MQDTKIILFHILAMNMWKPKLKVQRLPAKMEAIGRYILLLAQPKEG